MQLDRPSKWQVAAELLLLVALFFTYAGDPPPMVNEAHYLVKAKNFWQPQWCSHDLFASSGKAHTTFYTLFGWPSLFVSLQTTAWLGRVVGWLMLAMGLQRLCWSLFRRGWVSLAVAVIWIVGIEYGNLAGEWVVGGIEAKVPAYGLILLALAEMAQRRWTRVWPLLGAASAFHVLSGGWSVLAAMLAWWMTERGREEGQRLFTPWLFLGGAVSLLGLIPALWLTIGSSGEDATAAARIYAYYRIKHHLLPADFQRQWFVRHAMLIYAVVALVWIVTPKAKLWVRHPKVLFTLLTMAMAGLWFSLATTTIQPGIEEVEVLFGFVGLASIVALIRRTEDGWSQMEWFTIGAVTIALIGLMVGVLPAVVPDLAAKLLRYYWFRLTDAVVPLMFALLVMRLVWDKISPALEEVTASDGESGSDGRLVGEGIRRVIGWALLSVAIVLLSRSCLQRIRLGVPPSASHKLLGWDVQATPETQKKVFEDWVNVCRWARDASAEDEVFLTPRHQQSFKWYAQRAEVVNWKDVPQDAKSLREWYRRFQEIFPRRLGTVRVTIQYKDLRQYRKQYGVRYLIVDRRVTGKNLPLIRAYPTRFEPNDTFAVYLLPE